MPAMKYDQGLSIGTSDEFIQKMPDKYDNLQQQEAMFPEAQCQRLCIARALLKKPKILILDDFDKCSGYQNRFID